MDTHLMERLETAIVEDKENGLYRARRDVFTDPEWFELEMKHIFEGNWIYLAHESQIPNKNDYFTMYMGRQPIFIARNRNGELNAFINACSHRGAMLCRHKRANKATYTCPFHGWTFNNSGKLLKVKDPEGAGYPEQFNKDGSHGYHVSAVHWNYAATTSRRKTAVNVDTTRAMDAGGWAKQGGGFYSFENGHLLLWTRWSNPEDRPLYERRDELIAEHGQAKADWMIGISRNLCLYPNVYLMDQFGSQIRTYRPISVDKTEVTIYCIAPKNESAEARAQRIRQYEDFFNASGMATPDDLEEFRSCQIGYMATAAPWNDMSRGAEHWIEGPDDDAKTLGLDPVSSGVRTEDEGLFIVQHGYWKKALRQGLEIEAAEEAESKAGANGQALVTN